MFDPTVGRWFEEDPEGFDANDPNLYRYVKNSPTNATDPSGALQLPVAPPPRPVVPVAPRPRPATPIVAPRPRPAAMLPLKFTAGPVFSGHGEWFPEHGYTVVPRGTTITFFVPAGEFLGTVAEEDPLLKEPPSCWLDRKRPATVGPNMTWFDHRPSGRLIDLRSPSALAHPDQKDGSSYWYETYYAGEQVPDYTLFPAEGGLTGVLINGKPIPLSTPKVAVAGAGKTATTVKKPTKLSELLRANQGDVWWSACRQHNLPQEK